VKTRISGFFEVKYGRISSASLIFQKKLFPELMVVLQRQKSSSVSSDLRELRSIN
jgi:hypothetical protein